MSVEFRGLEFREWRLVIVQILEFLGFCSVFEVNG